MTSFADDPARSKFLMLTLAKYLGRDQMDIAVQWWKSYHSAVTTSVCVGSRCIGQVSPKVSGGDRGPAEPCMQ